ncbi:uncharacterized protein HKW66_Vig0170540 [Vigna angularis]|uniref:Uncharacterized protein n=1 Tax=Phaseolus angularis TaxID=3914 RepID=A0A8T0JPW2_PHAAN|nr:uncharacterized protein HKW66_Vig0170540 [Vigna angularis]
MTTTPYGSIIRKPENINIGGVLRERHDLLKRRGQRRGHGGVPAHGAGAVELEPGVETAEVKVVSTLGHHSQHLRILVLAETDGARGVVAAVFREGKLGVGVYDGLFEAGDSVVLSGAVVVVLGDEDNAREDDAIRGVGVVAATAVVVVAVAEGAAAEVGGEDEGGDEEEDSEGDGDGVAEAEVGEVRGGGWRGEGVEGGH